ncbi:MAG: DUF2842 domain-containing protein [Pseudomonadota bacterium]|nr:DUF2842 domain-containing protein [Pseudomonadota bacterium]
MSRSKRRLIASIIVMLFLVFWIWGAATIGSQLATAPKWISLVFFVVAGVGWALPLKPVFTWMNSGPEED